MKKTICLHGFLLTAALAFAASGIRGANIAHFSPMATGASLPVAHCPLSIVDDPLSIVDDDGDNDGGKHRYLIKGIINDETGEPLAGATVRVSGTVYGAGTNSDGEFTVRVDEGKTYTIVASFVGYEPVEMQVKASTTPKHVTITLRPSSNQLNEVVVTGSFVEKPLKDVPVLTRVVTHKDIEAVNPMTIEDLLQYELPGLQIGYNSMSQLPEITYQGMEGEYLLFLIDGERVSGEGADHNVDFTRFNVDDIERIEVIRGAQSTIYGSNALGGVINIITKSATRPFSGNLNARYAGTNGQKYTASVGFKRDRFSSYTSGTYRQRDTYTLSDTSTDDDGTTSTTSSTTVWGYKIWDVSQKFSYTFNEKLSADAKGSFYWNERAKRSSRQYQEYYIDGTFSAKVKYLINENQQLTFGYIYDNYKKDNRYCFKYIYGENDYKHVDSVYTNYRNVKQTPRIDYTGTFGKHTISAGFEGEIEYLKHYMLEDSSHVSNQAYALYLQEDWKIKDGLNIIAGLRADYHEKYHLHVTPKISLMYKPLDLLTLRVGYARGFRSPSLKELYECYDMGGMGYFMIYGNEDLKPETSDQFSLSAELNKGGWNASVSASHNRFHDKISYTWMTDSETNSSGYNDMQYLNTDKAKTTSIEAILRYRFNWGLTLTGSYVFTDDYEEVFGVDYETGESGYFNISSVRPHMMTFNFNYSHKFGKIGVNASLVGQWAGSFNYYTTGSDTDSDGYYLDANGNRYVDANGDALTVYELSSDFGSRSVWTLNMGVNLPRGISCSLGFDNIFNFKDKSSDSSLQVPQKGISVVGSVSINLADLFKL